MTVYYTPLATLTVGVVTIADSTHVQIVGGSVTQDYYGSGVTYSDNRVTGGTLTRTTYSDAANGGLQYEITGLHHNAVSVFNYVMSRDQVGLTDFLLNADDSVLGAARNDVLYGGAGADLIRGGAGNDAITGGFGTDTIYGDEGNDTLDGGWDVDILVGGSGDDTYVNTGNVPPGLPDDSMIELAGGGYDTVRCYRSPFTLPDQIEALVLMLPGIAVGNPLGNLIIGTEFGDILDGGPGNDTLQGGLGDDAYVIDSAGDTIVDTGGRDTIRTGIDGYVLGTPGIEYLELIGAAVSGSGDARNNRITGNALNNRLMGGGGDDYISGGAGTDTAVYQGARANFKLTEISINYCVLQDIKGTEGLDRFLDVERLRFADSGLALDTGAKQAGGQTALLIGAILGKSALTQKPALVGAVLDLFDQGFTLQQLSGAVMRLDIWGALANGGSAGASNAQIATYLLTTVNRTAPTAADLSAAVTSLNAEMGSMQGDFLWHLAESATNQTQVGLTGLAATGLEFI